MCMDKRLLYIPAFADIQKIHADVDMTIKQLIQEVEQVTERLSNKNPCNACKVDRQIGNPNRWECECDRCDKPNDWKNECVKKLAEYETAEEEGRLVVLPCKVGDIIFCLCRIGIRQFKVLSIEICEYGAILELLYAGNAEKYRFWRIYMESDDFGKKLFLKSEETEEALKEMKK